MTTVCSSWIGMSVFPFGENPVVCDIPFRWLKSPCIQFRFIATHEFSKKTYLNLYYLHITSKLFPYYHKNILQPVLSLYNLHSILLFIHIYHYMFPLSWNFGCPLLGKDRRTMEHLQKGLPPAVAGHQNLVRVEPHLTALSGSCTLMDKHSSGGPHGLAKWIRVDLRLWPSHRNRAQLKTCSGRSVVNGSCDSATCGWDMVSAYPRCQ